MLTTLSISTQEIKLVAVKGKKVKCWTSRALESGIVRDGRVLDPEKLGAIIAELFKTQNLPRNKVVVALSGLPYTYRIIEFPLLKDNQVEEAILRALPDELTIPIEDLCLSWSRLTTRPEGADYFILGVDRDLVDSFVQAMKIAGIKDWSMDLKPLALARVANATDAIVALLDFDHLDIVLVHRGHIQELHAVILDHDDQWLNFDRYMDQFVSEVVKILSFHHESGEGEEVPPTELPILVTGELIAQAGVKSGIPDESQIIASMNKLTGHHVSIIELPVSGPETFNANAFATNIGLFLKTRKGRQDNDNVPDRFHDVNIDILSGRFEKKPVMVPMWYTVAPVVVFLVVFGAWSLNNAYSDSSDHLNTLQAQMEQLTAQRLQKERRVNEQEKLQKQVTDAENTLKQLETQHAVLLEGKGTYPVCIADFTSSLPDNAALKSINIEIGAVELSGTVDSAFDVIAYIKALEALGYDPVNLLDIKKGQDGKFIFDITVDSTLAEGSR
jgi:Sec-independent protein translocase protein TatA